jgi:hypothetical protein
MNRIARTRLEVGSENGFGKYTARDEFTGVSFRGEEIDSKVINLVLRTLEAVL